MGFSRFTAIFAFSFLFAFTASAHSSNLPAQADVVVIGGGIAGLTTVEMLARKGITNVVLLEQAPRVGGKMWTERGQETGEGPYYERGAELVNTTDVELIALIKDLGLGLTERRFKSETRSEVFLFADRTLSADGQVINGKLKPFTFEELIDKMQEFPQDRAVLENILKLQTERTDSTGLEKRRLNQKIRSIKADTLVAEGVYTRSLLEALMKSEFGVTLSDVNAEVLLDYVHLEKAGGKIGLEIIPEADEKFRVTGGTDTIIQKLGERYKDKISMNTPVASVSQLGRSEFEIRTATNEKIKAAHVVFAVPSYDLTKIKIESPALPAERIREAAALPFGTNAKIFLVFDRKFWDVFSNTPHAFSGVGVLEAGVQFWDTTENQKSKKGVITVYPGAWPDVKSKQDQKLSEIIAQLEKVPGLSDLRTHLIAKDVQTWKKSYAGTFNAAYSRAPGLFAEDLAANIYFVGSDKDNNKRGEISASYGYMNGAVRTAMRAAERIEVNKTDFATSRVFRPAVPKSVRSCSSLMLSAG